MNAQSTEIVDRFHSVPLGNPLKKPAVQSPSTLSVKASANPNETDAFDTSDELLDDLVKNATLTASRDALKQRKTARYGAQRRSRTCCLPPKSSTCV